jgi:hypothetical protein
MGVTGSNKEGLLTSPSNRYLRSTYDTARYVPIGNEFDKESRERELGNLGEGLSLWAKAQAEVETTNDSIQSRRMAAEYMEASTQVFNQLQNDPSTMNNPAVWLDVYTEEMTSRIAEINNNYSKSFYVGRNQLMSNEQLNLLLKKEKNNVALMAADRVSKMAADETNASLKVAIANRDFGLAKEINQSPYLTPAQKILNENEITGAQTQDIIQQSVLRDPWGVVEEVNRDGSVQRRELTYEQQQYAMNQAQGQISTTQKQSYDSLVQKFLFNPEEFDLNVANKLLKNNHLTTQQYVNLLNMKKKMSAKVEPTPMQFKAMSEWATKLSEGYAKESPEGKANILSQAERLFDSMNFSTSDKNALVKLVTQKISPETFNQADKLVEKFWDNGQLPLTKTADYTGTQGGTTPIYLTEGEFNTQFKERKNQFFLDKSRTYLDPKTAKERFAVMEYVPDSNNLFLQEKIKSEVRSVLSDKIAEYRAEHNGKSPTGQELYELVFFAQEEAFSRNNISSIDPLSSASVYPSGQQDRDERKATFIPNNVRVSAISNKASIDIPTNGAFIVWAGSNSFITNEKDYLSIYKRAGAPPQGFIVADESFLQAPHKDLMDVQAMISAKAIAAKAGLDAQGEQGIYCALLSYWNNL